MTNTDPFTALITRLAGDLELACDLITDMITLSADSDDISLPDLDNDDTIAAPLTACYDNLTLDDDNLAMIADAFDDLDFSLHAAHIRDAMRDNSDFDD